VVKVVTLGGIPPSPYLLTSLETGSAVGTLSEAMGAMSVAPEHAEAMSSFVKARRPTERKEEVTEVIAASGRHELPH
jgi:hypothetical protein